VNEITLFITLVRFFAKTTNQPRTYFLESAPSSRYGPTSSIVTRYIAREGVKAKSGMLLSFR